MIALIDYGAGNLTSVRKALTAIGAEFFTPATPADLEGARAIIVPGVGHFAALRAIDDGWRHAILAAVDRSDADCFTAISAADRATLLRLLSACAADLESR